MQQGKQNLQHTTQHNSIWIEQIMFIVDKTSNFKLQNEQTKKIGLLLLLMEGDDKCHGRKHPYSLLII